MPEASGPPRPIDPSSTVDKLKVAEWLNSHWRPDMVQRSCTVCGVTKWTIAEDFAYLSTLGSGGAIQIGGRHFPLVILTCSNCGNTLLFNAIVMGLLPKKPEA